MTRKTCLNFTALIYFSLRFLLALSAPESALITEVPNFNGTLPSKHYAGYVTIDGSHGRRLYYYFVVSERNPSKDPLVLWLNGGPGCSSFDGFVYEHGPFNFQKGKTSRSFPTLHLNPYSWSKVSNILYADSPAGVGFSYSSNTSDYVTGEVKTALDSHTFLLKWFKLYPEFLPNPFYISGESYAGIYVPNLASEVVKDGSSTRIDAVVKPVINFKQAASDCRGNYYNSTSEKCDKSLSKIDEAIARVNIYDIQEPCYGASSTRLPTSNTNFPVSLRKFFGTERTLRSWPLRAPVRDGIVPTWPQLLQKVSVPCTDDEVATAWLNNKAVRKAIHAELV